MKRSINDMEFSVPETQSVTDVMGLRDHLQNIEDPRDPRGVRYKLVDLLVLLIGSGDILTDERRRGKLETKPNETREPLDDTSYHNIRMSAMWKCG